MRRQYANEIIYRVNFTLFFPHAVIFRSVRDSNAIRTMARQAFPQNSHYMISAYEMACGKPFGYLLFDASNFCNDLLRLRSKIFPSDSACEVYVPKKTFKK